MEVHARRIVVIAILSSAILVGIASGTVLLTSRPAVEILLTDVNLLVGVPEDGMTGVRVRLVLRNVGASPAHFSLLTLFAYHPTTETLFDTFSHTEIRIDPGVERTFSETTRVGGEWSEVAFTVKVFPGGSPSWERSLDPDQPVTWRVA